LEMESGMADFGGKQPQNSLKQHAEKMHEFSKMRKKSYLVGFARPGANPF